MIYSVRFSNQSWFLNMHTNIGNIWNGALDSVNRLLDTTLTSSHGTLYTDRTNLQDNSKTTSATTRDYFCKRTDSLSSTRWWNFEITSKLLLVSPSKPCWKKIFAERDYDTMRRVTSSSRELVVLYSVAWDQRAKRNDNNNIILFSRRSWYGNNGMPRRGQKRTQTNRHRSAVTTSYCDKDRADCTHVRGCWTRLWFFYTYLHFFFSRHFVLSYRR